MEFFSKECIKSWKTFSTDARLKHLQEFEHNCALFEKRAPREIILDGKSTTQHGKDNAHYSFENPSIISLRNISDNFFECLNDVFHEGFHAATDDFFNNKNDLLMFCDIDKKRLINEYELRDIIHNYCIKNQKELLFNIAYYEEKLVRKQTYHFLLLLAFDICDSENEFEDLLKKYFHEKIIGNWYSYNEFLKSCEIPISYNELISSESFFKDIEKYANKRRTVDTEKEILVVDDECFIEDIGNQFHRNLWELKTKRIKEHRYIYKQKKLYSKYHSKVTLNTLTFKSVAINN